MDHLLSRLATTRIVGAAVALACLAPAGARGQAVERAVRASVLDAKGAPVTDVSPGDVVVREDGIAREVLRVVPAAEPMDVALLVDTSAALSPDTNSVREALASFVATMVPANHVSIVGFGDRPTILADSTSNLQALQKGIGLIFPKQDSGAYALDAVLEVSRGFQKRQTPRPVIVMVVADGEEFSNLPYERVLDALKASGAAMFVMNLTRPGVRPPSDEWRNRSILLARGTEETGGQRVELVSSLGLPGALAKLADQLLHQVRVIYAHPQTLIPPERVTIESARPGFTARGTPVKPAKGA